MSGQGGMSRNQMRPGERSDSLGYMNRGGAPRPVGMSGAMKMGAPSGGPVSGGSNAPRPPRGPARGPSSTQMQTPFRGATAVGGAPVGPRGGSNAAAQSTARGAGGPVSGQQPMAYMPPTPQQQQYGEMPVSGYLDAEDDGTAGGYYEMPPMMMATPDAAAFYPPPPPTTAAPSAAMQHHTAQVQSGGGARVTFKDDPSQPATSVAVEKRRDADVAKLATDNAVIRARLEDAEGRISSMQARIEELSAQLRHFASVQSQQPSPSQQQSHSASNEVYALVNGGSSETVLLYADIPTSPAEMRSLAKAKASKGKWLKLTLPRQKRQVVAEDGSDRVEWWYHVHVVDPSNGEGRYLWVSDKANDGSASFEKFATYPQ